MNKVEGPGLLKRPWRNALGIYLPVSIAWAGSALITTWLGMFGMVILGAFTPMPGAYIGDSLTHSGDAPAFEDKDEDENDEDDAPRLMAAFGFATGWSLLVLSPGLFWLRTRHSGWLILQILLLVASACSWVGITLHIMGAMRPPL
jgi:hypothetical protein